MPHYARHGKILAKPGQRDRLIAILSHGARAEAMPGCELYVIGAATDDQNAVLITEIWDTAEAHQASLQLPAVAAAIAEAMPMIGSVEGEAMSVVAGWPKS